MSSGILSPINHAQDILILPLIVWSGLRAQIHQLTRLAILRMPMASLHISHALRTSLRRMSAMKILLVSVPYISPAVSRVKMLIKLWILQPDLKEKILPLSMKLVVVALLSILLSTSFHEPFQRQPASTATFIGMPEYKLVQTASIKCEACQSGMILILILVVGLATSMNPLLPCATRNTRHQRLVPKSLDLSF